MKQKILITGAAGVIGKVLVKALGRKYELKLIDKASATGLPNYTMADISYLEEVERFFQGVDIVIHLAADRVGRGRWSSIIANNVTGVYNIFEAAKRHGVKKIIFMSTHNVMGMYALENFNNITADMAVRPDSLYGVSKLFGENIGSYYSENFGISVVCLRIGIVTSENDPSGDMMMRRIWLSHRDLIELVERSIKAENLQFEIINGVSNNKRGIFDLTKGKKVLGFMPKDNAEEFYK